MLEEPGALPDWYELTFSLISKKCPGHFKFKWRHSHLTGIVWESVGLFWQCMGADNDGRNPKLKRRLIDQESPFCQTIFVRILNFKELSQQIIFAHKYLWLNRTCYAGLQTFFELPFCFFNGNMKFLSNYTKWLIIVYSGWQRVLATADVPFPLAFLYLWPVNSVSHHCS
jgi:hypothetical protein